MNRTNSQIIFKTSKLKSSLRYCSDAYTLVKGTIKILNTAGAGNAANNIAKKVINKNCAPLIDSIYEIKNTQVNNATGIDVFMAMYNLIKYIDNYLKTLGSLWWYCRDETAINDVNDDITDFNVANTVTNSFKFKQKIMGKTSSSGTEGVDIIVPLKYLPTFLKTLDIPFTAKLMPF